VAGGASVSFLPPLSRERSLAFWKRVSTGVAQGKCLLLAAWLDGQLAGTVQLDLATPENQPHRAEVAKLLVDPAFRRRGIGAALMRRAEQAAQRLGRRVLTLDTGEGDDGEPLYRRLGWTEGGRIPAYYLDAQGAEATTVYFWKRIA
jgi:GNAT superfamily N-acetyltransferase